MVNELKRLQAVNNVDKHEAELAFKMWLIVCGAENLCETLTNNEQINTHTTGARELLGITLRQVEEVYGLSQTKLDSQEWRKLGVYSAVVMRKILAAIN